jgi:hypothetical protein
MPDSLGVVVVAGVPGGPPIRSVSVSRTARSACPGASSGQVIVEQVVPGNRRPGSGTGSRRVSAPSATRTSRPGPVRKAFETPSTAADLVTVVATEEEFR